MERHVNHCAIIDSYTELDNVSPARVLIPLVIDSLTGRPTLTVGGAFLGRRVSRMYTAMTTIATATRITGLTIFW